MGQKSIVLLFSIFLDLCFLQLYSRKMTAIKNVSRFINNRRDNLHIISLSCAAVAASRQHSQTELFLRERERECCQYQFEKFSGSILEEKTSIMSCLYFRLRIAIAVLKEIYMGPSMGFLPLCGKRVMFYKNDFFPILTFQLDLSWWKTVCDMKENFRAA